MLGSAILNFDDPHAYAAAIHAADLKLFPTIKGDFRAELTQVTLERLWMQRGSENLPRVFFGTIKPGRAVVSFFTDSDQPAMQHCGMDVSPGEIIVNNHELIHRRTAAASRWGSMSLEQEDFATASEAICGRELTVPETSHVVRPDPALMSRLLQLHETAAKFARSNSDIAVVGGLVRSLKNTLIHAMVRCLDVGPPPKMGVSGRQHKKIIARFEEFLAENMLQPVYLAEICAATGASERTLRECCQEHLGMGPVH
jgi:hypothetical protein